MRRAVLGLHCQWLHSLNNSGNLELSDSRIEQVTSGIGAYFRNSPTRLQTLLGTVCIPYSVLILWGAFFGHWLPVSPAITFFEELITAGLKPPRDFSFWQMSLTSYRKPGSSQFCIQLKEEIVHVDHSNFCDQLFLSLRSEFSLLKDQPHDITLTSSWNLDCLAHM